VSAITACLFILGYGKESMPLSKKGFFLPKNKSLASRWQMPGF